MKQPISQIVKLLSILVFTIAGILFSTLPAYAQTPQCIHGMRIIGEKTIYLSHMPLFNSTCHSYQVLLEATFQEINMNWISKVYS
ncbi:hypothetical protein DSM106972_031010 [Dulcicalothrix desertica PCC 7102]|uniref:Uncharacterized protein n=1 Tax=Dulcicalothrix desertica PCC 7102 TaxID=232991 RepID=A0A3S1B6G2_9CYAN|nr:hypothetical protein [Dulcicalothrix desertica]RUT05895.1 hypothetical protein DSM106972_031010 [Dulcicalothrix desertica PCC 7102]TWH54408.1 hypothetical protein CAL7102_02439 [Dulcicalothrix desertica PCC 7102]